MVWYIVGGAQTKILHFVENLHHKDNLFPVPPLFTLIQEQSKTDWKEMYQVLTGHRMEIYVPEAVAQDIMLFQNRSMSMLKSWEG
jgi:phosphoribosylformylglycinamidine cyclo-ligase